jgi:hypothetical protein
MAFDGCTHSYAKLAHEVLPDHMKEIRISMKKPIKMNQFGIRGNGKKTLAKANGFPKDIRGCYLFLENKKPIYVGISGHVFARLLQHTQVGDHLTASLAYRMAKQKLPHETTASLAMLDPAFRAEFDAQRSRILDWDVAIIEIPNPLELYLFEVYCAMELKTSLENGGQNTFALH